MVNRRAAAAVVIAVSVLGIGMTSLAQDASVGIHKAHIYPGTEAAATDIQAALADARRTHRRVLLDFGGDWCPDCQVLNIYFQQSPNSELLSQNFVRVNVNVGHQDANRDIAARYGVPLKGVPALAVLDGNGRVLYAQNNQFADMRHLDSAALTTFLNQWKP
jgi:thioredoxin 1